MDEFRNMIRTKKKMNLLMVAINIAVFLVLSLMGNTEDGYFMLNHGACYAPVIIEGEYYRLVTGMFLHFGIYHLVYNMICLFFVGDYLEELVGPVRYLIIYLGGGLAGNLLSMGLELRSGRFAVSAGASGAIFAVIGALLYIILRNRGRVGRITVYRMVLMVALSILQGFMDVGTDNAAHIGGLAGGFVLAVLLYRKRRTGRDRYSFRGMRDGTEGSFD